MRRNVLDYGYIELFSVFGDDRQIAGVARLSHRSESRGPEHDGRLLKNLLQKGHTTPFEFCELIFLVKAPLMVCQQWTRHRTWAFNFMSGRYVRFDEIYEPDVVWPFDLRAHYGQCMALYEQAIEAGIKPEQARCVLPGFAVFYEFYAKVDLHNFMHWLRLRVDKAAQWEHRQYAEAALDLFHEVFPVTARLFEDTLK